MTSSDKSPASVREALLHLLSCVHEGRLVPDSKRSRGYIDSVVQAGEAALASTPAVHQPDRVSLDAVQTVVYDTVQEIVHDADDCARVQDALRDALEGLRNV
jgi:hypothetical protein